MTIADPRDIPGLVAWYSAESETGYSDGAAMTQWTDRSGNGNHAIAVLSGAGSKPKWQATGGPSGGARIQFNGTSDPASSQGGYFTLPAGLMSSMTAAEAHLKVRSDSGRNPLWLLGDYNHSAGATAYPWSGVLGDTFGRLASRVDGAPVLSLNTWRHYSVWAADFDWCNRLDGTVQNTATDKAFYAFPGTPWLGAGRNNIASLLVFGGTMSLFVLFDHKLTTTERADLDAWIAANPSGGTVATPDENELAQVFPGFGSEVAVENVHHFDVSNAANLRQRVMRCNVDITYPVAPVPAGVSEAERHDAIIAYPQPTLVDGRPT